MPRKTVWTEGQDAQIRRLRTEGAPWEVIALALGLARWTIIERARDIGIERPPAHAAAAMDEFRPPAASGRSYRKLGRYQPRDRPARRAIPNT